MAKGEKEAARIRELRARGRSDADIACDGKLAVGFRWLKDHPGDTPAGSRSAATPRGSGAIAEPFRPLAGSA